MLYDGSLGADGTFQLGLRIQGSKVSGEYTVRQRGSASVRRVEGTLSGTRVDVSAAGKPELQLALELKELTLGGTVTLAGVAPVPLSGKKSAPLVGMPQFERSFEVVLGKKRGVR